MSIGARAAPPASTFSFPLLSIGDILAIFPDMGLLGLKDKDLSEPKPETAQKIYEQFVYMCMDKSKEELSQPSFSALDAIKWPVRSRHLSYPCVESLYNVVYRAHVRGELRSSETVKNDYKTSPLLSAAPKQSCGRFLTIFGLLMSYYKLY